ncbi:MAG: hypothetical protein A2W90_19075 [Bacteroidetes bacterium GWF2_42_66]|nr:MAG: hypothetical protein A2W90_19075 [Bacteroidetes bacterium GWF2_42_66]HBL77082.1 hypothetical protein [Prolixibacteraceae bacterium]HCU59864.1 hypothetical protein [Prolixibacteraceae bacterium]
MRSVIIFNIFFILLGVSVLCQNCRDQEDNPENKPEPELPKERFMVMDTFDAMSGQIGIQEGWDRCTNPPGLVSIQQGKDGGKGLMVDGRDGVVCLRRLFSPQTGVFTAEMDVCMLSTPQALFRISIAGDTWYEDYEKLPVGFMRDNRSGTTPQPFKYYNKGWQDTKITPELSRWYHLKFVVDVPNQCYDVWIDGVLKGSKCAFRNPAEEVNCLSVLVMGREDPMYSFAPGDAVAIDNVIIYPKTERPPEGSFVETYDIPNGETTPAPVGKPGYSLTFQDEFDGNELNKNLWNIARTRGAIVPDSLVQEFYPYEIKNGILNLRIEERRNKDITFNDGYLGEAVKNYTAPVIASFNKFEQEYGWFEIRCKMPKTFGIWAGFWLFPVKGSPGAAEIDIFESLSKFNDRIFFNIHYHWVTPKINYRKPGIWVPGLADGFHTYALDWQPGKITMHVDGTKVYEYTGNDVPVGPLYIIVSCRTGGWGGPFVDNNSLPDNFEIDYVRVYKKE